MGTAEHYDVVIIGRDLAGLLAAALLARRGRRVRVIFPDAPPDPVPRPPLFGLQAPVVQRGLDALGLVHATRSRLAGPPAPVVIALPDRRLTLEPTLEARGRALGAAFPEARAELIRLFDRIEGYGRCLDQLLSGDTELPPDGFAARRLLRRQVMALPVSLLVGVAPPWSEVPALRGLIGTLLAVAGRHEDPAGPISAAGARAIWHLCQGVHRFKDGPGALAEMVTEKLRSFGGLLDPERTVKAVTVRRQRVVAIYDNRQRRHTAEVVLFADDDAVLAELLGTPPPEAPVARVRHAVVPLADRPQGLVDPLGWLPSPGGTPARVRAGEQALRMVWRGDEEPAELFGLTPFAEVDADVTEACHLPVPGDEVDLLRLFRQPIRGPLKNLLRAGPWVLPGLGLEGDFLTAWIAADVAGRLLPRRARVVPR
ncbi:MAG: hypothetical protein H6706_03895 [Myxococcales bacterium]|nr:hypothetical protein [Myxococcales bacterium]